MYLKFRYFVFIFVFTICIPFYSLAQIDDNIGRKGAVNTNTSFAVADSTTQNDSSGVNRAQGNNNLVDTQVKYEAQDSIILSNDNKKVYLFKQAKVEYGDIVLEADYIEYDQEKNYVYATGVEDSLGNLHGKPNFKDKNDEFIARAIKYNFKTQKGYIEDVFTEEEQGFLHSQETKKLADNSFLLRSGKYTTCDNEDHPHFYLSMSKAKVIPNDKIISGPAHIVLADIPIKFLGVPFGFFPSQSEYSSGIIIPSYGEEKNRGFFLRDGGYYFGISDKMDLAVTGSIYSKGSWASDVEYRYKKRYKFNSNFNFSYSEYVKSEKGLPDYTRSKDMAIRWNHTQDPKANPTRKFSASVNYSTSSYDDFNSTSLEQRNTNTKQSNISYGKNWAGSPFRLTADLKHTQNSNTDNISLILPVMSFNMDRQYPFRRKSSTGETKWYEDIEIQYSSQLKNQISTTDTLLFKSQYGDDYVTGTKWEDYENGFQHKIPLSTNFKILQHFNLSPRVEYTGILYPNYVEYTSTLATDENGQQFVDIDTIEHQTIKYAQIVNPSISLSVGPNIYGMYQMKNEDSKLIAVRHVVTPSVSVSFRPDLGSMVDDYYGVYYSSTDTLFENPREYSIFKEGLYSLPAAPGKSGSVNFGLNNNLEMKVRDLEDTTGTGTKKVKLLESFKLSTSYNIFADSLNWSPISISARTSMFNNKLSFQASGKLDPYAVNQTTGKVYNEFEWNTGGGIGRLTRFDFTVDVKLNSRKDDEGGGKNQRQDMGVMNDRFSKFDDNFYDMQEQYMTYVDFSVPWNLGLNYKFIYSKPGLSESKSVKQTLSLNGQITLTEKWAISFRANYDLVENTLSNGSINITRDLHCWQASFNWIPVGYMQSFNFQINVKGSTLKDFLKYNKRESWQDNL